MEPPQEGDHWFYSAEDGGAHYECYYNGANLEQRPYTPQWNPPQRRIIPTYAIGAWKALVGGPVGAS